MTTTLERSLLSLLRVKDDHKSDKDLEPIVTKKTKKDSILKEADKLDQKEIDNGFWICYLLI